MFTSLSKAGFPHIPAALLVIALGSLLSGCTTANRVSMNAGQRASLGKTQAIIGQSQQEIDADIEESNASAAMGGGLIAALIDTSINNSRAKKALAAATPVRDALVSYDPNKTLITAMQSEMTAQPWLHFDHVEVRSITEFKDIITWSNNVSQGQLLTVLPHYRLTPKCDGITINAMVRLSTAKPKSSASDGESSKPEAPVLYWNNMVVCLPMPGGCPKDITPAEAAKLWSDNGGAKARVALDLGFAELARLIAFDLTVDAPAKKALYKAPDGATELDAPHMNGLFFKDLDGYVVSPPNSPRTWVRIPTGELFSLSK